MAGERSAGRGGGKRSDSQPPAGAAMDAEDPPPQRLLRTVFQRRSPEEHALRSAAINELVRLANQPSEDGSPWPGTRGAAPSSLSGIGAQLRQPSPLQDAADGPLHFSSAFECGNLACAKLVCPPGKGGSSSSSATAEQPTEVEYELYIDSDTQSQAGHTQWFYFCVRSQEFKGLVHFRIVNMRKKRSLYQHGLQPHVYSVRRNRGWQAFACEGISYATNCNQARAARGGDGFRADQHTLSFSYRVDHPNDEIYFASYPPYTYSMLCGFLARLERHSLAKAHLRRCELCRSIGQLPVPFVVVSQDINGEAEDMSRTPSSERKPARPAVAVIARQHPGEVVGSLVAQGLLKFLLGPTPAARRLREAYVFHVVPMVNVDGVVHGNSRCTLAGVDPNRVWHDPNPIIHPVIFALKNHLRNVAQGCAHVPGRVCRGLELFLDLHGHSAKFGCFFYGSCATAPISNALFPKLCAITSRDISFEQCHWRCPRSHRKTARYVVYKQLGVQCSYTLECSLFASVAARGACSNPDISEAPNTNGAVGRLAGASFTPGRMEWVGCALGRAAATFLRVDGDCDGCSAEAGAGEDAEEGDQSPSNSDVDFLPDMSCPRVLAPRHWLTLHLLESTTAAEVLEGLCLAHGDRVPEPGRGKGGDGSDDAGDSDGDDVPEPELDTDGDARTSGKEHSGASQQGGCGTVVRQPRKATAEGSHGHRRAAAVRHTGPNGSPQPREDGGDRIGSGGASGIVPAVRRVRGAVASVVNRARSHEQRSQRCHSRQDSRCTPSKGNPFWLEDNLQPGPGAAVANLYGDGTANPSMPSADRPIAFSGQSGASWPAPDGHPAGGSRSARRPAQLSSRRRSPQCRAMSADGEAAVRHPKGYVPVPVCVSPQLHVFKGEARSPTPRVGASGGADAGRGGGVFIRGGGFPSRSGQETTAAGVAVRGSRSWPDSKASGSLKFRKHHGQQPRRRQQQSLRGSPPISSGAESPPSGRAQPWRRSSPMQDAAEAVQERPDSPVFGESLRAPSHGDGAAGLQAPGPGDGVLQPAGRRNGTLGSREPAREPCKHIVNSREIWRPRGVE
uniref:Peptidase M14 domain-containing protein n=1 Tax=Pyrodinium bahamense TaxID=73915 RepID=A0A7S0AL39_9DINO